MYYCTLYEYYYSFSLMYSVLTISDDIIYCSLWNIDYWFVNDVICVYSFWLEVRIDHYWCWYLVLVFFILVLLMLLICCWVYCVWHSLFIAIIVYSDEANAVLVFYCYCYDLVFWYYVLLLTLCWHVVFCYYVWHSLFHCDDILIFSMFYSDVDGILWIDWYWYSMMMMNWYSVLMMYSVLLI